MLFAERLLIGVFRKMSILMQLQKDILRNLGVLYRRSSAKDVESQLEPFVDLGVDLVVFCAELFWGDTFF